MVSYIQNTFYSILIINNTQKRAAKKTELVLQELFANNENKSRSKAIQTSVVTT